MLESGNAAVFTAGVRVRAHVFPLLLSAPKHSLCLYTYGHVFKLREGQVGQWLSKTPRVNLLKISRACDLASKSVCSLVTSLEPPIQIMTESAELYCLIK